MGTRDQTEQCRVGYVNREPVARFELSPGITPGRRGPSTDVGTGTACRAHQVRGLHDGALDNTQRAVRVGSRQGQELADGFREPRVLSTGWLLLRCGVPVVVGEYRS